MLSRAILAPPCNSTGEASSDAQCTHGARSRKKKRSCSSSRPGKTISTRDFSHTCPPTSGDTKRGLRNSERTAAENARSACQQWSCTNSPFDAGGRRQPQHYSPAAGSIESPARKAPLHHHRQKCNTTNRLSALFLNTELRSLRYRACSVPGCRELSESRDEIE